MGAAYNPPDSLKESYVEEANRGCVARLEYKIRGWSAFWMKLQGADLSPYSRLIIDVRGDPASGIPKQMKLELKRGGQVSISYISGIGPNGRPSASSWPTSVSQAMGCRCLRGRAWRSWSSPLKPRSQAVKG